MRHDFLLIIPFLQKFLTDFTLKLSHKSSYVTTLEFIPDDSLTLAGAHEYLG